MNQLKIRTHQTIGIEAGRLSALLAGFNGQVLVVIAFLLVPQQLLVLVATIETHKFSAHGVGKDVRTTIVVARGPSVVMIMIVVSEAMLSSKRGSSHGRRQNRRSTPFGFVRQTIFAKGHVVAGLAPEAWKGLVVVVRSRVVVAAAAGIARGRIKDIAPVAALGILLFCVAFGTAPLSRTWFGKDSARFVHSVVVVLVVIVVAGEKGVWIFQLGSVLLTKLVANVRKGRRLNAFLPETVKEYLDALIGEKSQNIPRQNFLWNRFQQITTHRCWYCFRHVLG